MTIPLSVVIPVKNDERNLRECLPRLRDFDDVWVVDSGSTDSTEEVAREFGGKVVQFKWDGHFPKKRNWALRNLKFKHEWVLFLDADERMTEGWKKEVAEFLRPGEAEKFGVLRCFYDNWFCGRMLRHGDVMQKTAAVRVGAAEYERIEENHWSSLDMEIHEHLQVKEGLGEKAIGARLEHHDMRSMESHVAKHREYAAWEAGRFAQLKGDQQAWAALTERQRVKYGNVTKWWFAPAYFAACYLAKRGFLDGVAGFRFAAFKAWYFRQVRKAINGAIKNAARP